MKVALFARHIGEARGERSYRDVAEASGVSRGSLNRIEAGGAPDLNVFERLCKFYRLNPNDYLDVPEPAPKLKPVKVQQPVGSTHPVSRVSGGAATTGTEQ